MALQLIVTNAGRAALVNAQQNGTAPVIISALGLSAAGLIGNPAMVALPGEFKRINTLSGQAVGADVIHLLARDESADVYSVRSIALYLANGTVFAIYGQTTPILDKAAASVMLLAADIKFADISAASLNFGDANFLNPPATETMQGVAELATQVETDTGTDDARIVTPKKLRAAVFSWFAGILSDVWRASNDGSGSGLDADLLDGQEGAYYTNITARLGYTPLNAANYTAADVRTKLLGVDGSGSGVDADLLDGQEGSWYANIIARLGFTPANKAGDTFTGNVVASNGTGSATLLASGDVRVDRGNGQGLLTFGGTGTRYFHYDGTNFHLAGAPLYIAGNLVWHSGNDGAGSGLDADLLDGLQAASFLRRETDVWITSSDGVPRFHFTASGPSYFGTGGAGWRFQHGTDVVTIDTAGNVTANGSVRAGMGASNATLGNNGDITANRGNGTGAIFFGGNGGRYLFSDGGAYHLANAELWTNGGRTWHSNNDGSGSGLDADLLDGYDSSAFTRVVSQNLSGNGHIAYANGLKECWGSVYIGAGQQAYIGLPIEHSSWMNVSLGAFARGTANAQNNTALISKSGVSGFTLVNWENVGLQVDWSTRGV